MVTYVLRSLGLMPPRRPRGAVFRFWDGARERVIDPVAAWYRLDEATGEKWKELLRTVATDPPPVPPGSDPAKFEKAIELHEAARKDAGLKLADAVCKAFGVSPLTDGAAAGTETGLTHMERITLAAAYLEHMGGLAGAARAHPTSASPSGTA